jgi:NADPH-dependent curcumin reductase CurA
MTDISSREWHLLRRPIGMPKVEDFELATTKVPPPVAGQVQVRNLWMSVDPYMRGRMTDRESYVPPFQIGHPLEGGAVGQVTQSDDPSFIPGDLVLSMYGWREAFNAKPGTLQKLPNVGLPPQAFLGIAGMPGLTAYAGLLRVAAAKAGETVFVSGAAGAVGSIVCQIAKLKGLNVVGSAGGHDKSEWLKTLGCDAVIDYKAYANGSELTAALKQAAPKGIDIYFDNVGGDHLYAAIECARPRARLVICGMISAYNATAPLAGPGNIISVIPKRLRIEGFIVSDHNDMLGEFLGDMAGWITQGQIRYEETVDHGIAAAPEAFLKLFSGGNTGKMLVKLT